MKQTIIAIIITLLFSCSVKSQEREIFIGESKLKDCLLDFPLTYMTKDKDSYMKKAQELQEKELIFLTLDKKNKTAVFQRLFVIIMKGPNGDIIYLETKEDHLRESGNKKALLTRFYPNKNRYYLAECFDKKMMQDELLKNTIKEE